MKRLIFILLKIAEIILIPICYCLFTYIGWLLTTCIRYAKYSEVFAENPHDFSFNFFILGLWISIIVFMTISFFILVFPKLFRLWIQSNHEWSEKITNWVKHKN